MLLHCHKQKTDDLLVAETIFRCVLVAIKTLSLSQASPPIDATAKVALAKIISVKCVCFQSHYDTTRTSHEHYYLTLQTRLKRKRHCQKILFRIG